MKLFLTAMLCWALLASAAPAEEAPHMLTLRGPANLADRLGTREFCANGEALCRVSEPTSVVLDAAMMRLLTKVLRDTNASIRYEDQYKGKVPLTVRWRKGARVGDCRDYTIATLQALFNAGIPLGALSIGIVSLPGYGGIKHAMVVVNTEKGDFIVDSRRIRVIRWDKPREYVWLFRTRPGNPLIWEFVGRHVGS